MRNYREILSTFDLNSLPDLDVAVLGALDLYANEMPSVLPEIEFKKPLVIGSGNAYTTGKIIFGDNPNSVFADESNYVEVLDKVSDTGGVVLITASGGKHSVEIAKELEKRDLPRYLLTTTPKSSAADHFGPRDSFVSPKNREPYTYNTSTYLGMILMSRQDTDPEAVLSHIENVTKHEVNLELNKFDCFTFVIPKRFAVIKDMIQTKFDELFGPMVQGRVFNEEEIKHAKTLVYSPNECFVYLGTDDTYYGVTESNLEITLNPEPTYTSVIAIGYYLVGQIQKQKPPYFKNNLEDYTNFISDIFKQTIKPIVE